MPNHNQKTLVRYTPTVHAAMFKLVWRYDQSLSGFLAKGNLPRVSPHLILLTNDNSDEMIPGAVHRPPSIYFAAEENGVPYLQMRSVESHRRSGRKSEGEKERTNIGRSHLWHLLQQSQHKLFLFKTCFCLLLFTCH